MIAALLAVDVASWPATAGAEPTARILVGLDAKAFFKPIGFHDAKWGGDTCRSPKRMRTRRLRVAGYLVERRVRSSFSPDSVLMSRFRSRIFCLSSFVSRVFLRAKVLDSDRGKEKLPTADKQEDNQIVLVVDVTEAARPRIVHALPLCNSVYGPPTNIAITPGGRLGLVASPMRIMREGACWGAEPDDRLPVIDLAVEKPALVESIMVGWQPSGLAIGPDGDVALMANRAGRSITVLSIEGRMVRPVAEVDLGEEVAGVAIAPDSRTALAVKNRTGFMAVLRLDSRRASHDPAADLPVGFDVYSADFTPDGRLAITTNTGLASDGHADTASVIRFDGLRPQVSADVTIGDTPEMLAIAPDACHAVAVMVRGP
ncbi:hypothetical protein CkaCkLH20_12603 [Colletotrichum karsti]|uniref:Uncharacterized protein n=1 Tax=Colletotrichum karsti TaxID=1095194 RepID=A0A9P6LEA9_9PEZI|nr:uncharacterized protein CkaCkLH20_12603 [Colletotrichum karsti]KAF9869896.1 hypothetical protein CkaCkLH20_12603 [Colletotrichum karsti]